MATGKTSKDDSKNKILTYFPEVGGKESPWSVILKPGRIQGPPYDIYNQSGRCVGHLYQDGELILLVPTQKDGWEHRSTGNKFPLTRQGLLQAVRLAYLMHREILIKQSSIIHVF